jgi:16S rRNA processing protein RimM
MKSTREGSNGVIARFAEVTDRNAAEALRGTELSVPRSALPPLEEGEYYHADIIGLSAIASDGEELGHVVLIENFGAGDVLEIERPDGRRFMVPMNAQAVPEWDQDRLIVERSFIA